MFEFAILPFVIVTCWLIIQAVPWVIGIMAALLVLGLIVEGRKNR